MKKTEKKVESAGTTKTNGKGNSTTEKPGTAEVGNGKTTKNGATSKASTGGKGSTKNPELEDSTEDC